MTLLPLYKQLMLLLLGCFLSNTVFNQVSYELVTTHFGEEKGFAERTTIADVKTDSENNIWIVHFEGLVRYDGQQFTSIKKGDIDHDILLRFNESPLGKKYLIDGANQIFFVEADTLRPYEMNDSIKAISKGRRFKDFYLDHHNSIHLSIPNYEYIIIDSNHTIRYPLIKNNISMNGLACFFMKGRAPFYVYKFSRERDKPRYIYLFDEEKELVEKHPLTDIKYTDFPSMAKLRNNNYLLATGKGQLIEFNEDGFVKEHLYENPIIGLLSDSLGNLWLSDKAEGICFYEESNINPSNRKVVVPAPYTVASAIDFQGGIWYHSMRLGLNRIDYPHFRSYSKALQLDKKHRVYAWEVVKNKLLYATQYGILYELDLQSNAVKTSAPTHSNDVITGLFFDPMNHRLWLSQRGGLFYKSSGKWHELAKLKKLFNDQGRLFYFERGATSDSSIIVCRSKNQYFHIRDTTIDYVSPPFSQPVFAVLHQGDSTWVSTEAGVFLQLPDTIIDLKKKYPVLKGKALEMAYFNNQVWLSLHNKGLYVMRNDSLKPVKFLDRIVQSRSFFSISDDEFWISSTSGTLLFSTQLEANHFTGTNMSVFDKLPPHAGYLPVTKDSSTYFMESRKGILKTDFKHIKENIQRSPQLVLNKIAINDVNQSLTEDSFALQYNNNYLHISYVGINYTRAEVSYRYKMTGPGFADIWRETNESSLRFIQLPPGEFQFELQTQLKEQPWSTSKKLFFSVPHPFWQTWWFWVLFGTVIISISYWVITLRVKIIDREKGLMISRLTAEQQALRAKMDPHFVFNIISSAQYLIMTQKNDKAIKFLQIFSRLMRNVLDQSSKPSIPLEMELASLEGYIELEYYRLGEKFKYTINGADQAWIKTEKIIPFVIQPFVENAIHHGLKYKENGGKLSLDISLEDPFLKLVVEDNGIGRRAAKKNKSEEKSKQQSHGIKITRDRLKLHNGSSTRESLLVDDLVDSDGKAIGTRVTIFIKRIAE